QRFLPGGAVVVRDAQRAALAGEEVAGVREQQLLRPRIALGRIREPGSELGVVPRIHELLIDTEVLPARAAVGGDGDPPVPTAGVIARVQQDPLVGELDDRRLIHVLAHGRAPVPGLAVVVGEKSTYERTTSPPVGPSPAAPGRNQPQYG